MKCTFHGSLRHQLREIVHQGNVFGIVSDTHHWGTSRYCPTYGRIESLRNSFPFSPNWVRFCAPTAGELFPPLGHISSDSGRVTPSAWAYFLTTMYYNVLQCTTMYYNVLQCTTMYYSVLQCTRMYYNVLQCTTMYYNVLQCTTTYYNVLQCTTTYYNVLQYKYLWILTICRRDSRGSVMPKHLNFKKGETDEKTFTFSFNVRPFWGTQPPT